MPLGLISTQDQLAAFRDDSDDGVALVHVDTCLGSYLQDHHTRDGECLFGVYVDGTTTNHAALQSLLDEMRQTGDRVPDHITDDTMKACAKSWFAERDMAVLFDSSLESPELDEDGDPIEDMGGDEMCQAWFVLTWNVEGADDA